MKLSVELTTFIVCEGEVGAGLTKCLLHCEVSGLG